eukprot:TRINITY_DN7287_c0_g1_i3.p1 TRINITY_DN7287_c0_g1~~TRINITY_DN7287_c0_g1_i3.p1  ORF type:complete len:108 (+),score=3.03 TRINITY_DN7287_c0_g1_i3:373-696(+)
MVLWRLPTRKLENGWHRGQVREATLYGRCHSWYSCDFIILFFHLSFGVTALALLMGQSNGAELKQPVSLFIMHFVISNIQGTTVAFKKAMSAEMGRRRLRTSCELGS